MALTDINSEDRLPARKMGTANVLVVTLAKGSFGADFMVSPGRGPILFKQWGGKNRNRLVVY